MYDPPWLCGNEKRATPFGTALRSFQDAIPNHCMTFVQILSINDWAFGEQVGAKKTLRSDRGSLAPYCF